MFFRFGKKITSILIIFIDKLLKATLIIPRGTCRFYPSCSDYAQEAIKSFPLHKALLKILIRTFKCNPFFRGGFDPVKKI
jgi:uncharacterized protein